eukprot:g2314.t1
MTRNVYNLVVVLVIYIATAVSVSSPLPRPTPDQYVFQSMEIGALISYNMATAAGTQGCGAPNVMPPNASVFNGGDLPQDGILNTDQWCEAISSFGGKYATLVAKHLCGFTLWPSQASSGNFTYDYGTTSIDVIRQLAESCNAVGVKLGLYYSVNVNAYLNVANGQVQPYPDEWTGPRITQNQYADIVLQQLQELWTSYGPLAEIWFDGGYAVPGLQEKLLLLLNETQPHAAVFNGCGLTPNAVMWIGSESGHAPHAVWNTDTGCPADGSAGNVSGTSYMPKEVDLTLQNGDTWFYDETKGYRTLKEMISIYHDSVGLGGNMLLNLAPPHNSTLPDIAMPLAHGRCSSCWNLTLATTGSPMRFDTVLLKEELAGGQKITSFEIWADEGLVYKGTAVGRTLIVRFANNLTEVSSVQVRVLTTRDDSAPALRLVAIPDPDVCAAASSGGGGNDHTTCRLEKNVIIGGSPLKDAFATHDVPACCDACRNDTNCVAFTAAPGVCMEDRSTDESSFAWENKQICISQGNEISTICYEMWQYYPYAQNIRARYAQHYFCGDLSRFNNISVVGVEGGTFPESASWSLDVRSDGEYTGPNNLVEDVYLRDHPYDADVLDSYCFGFSCVKGCDDPSAENYDPGADFQDRTACIYKGCMDPAACNFDHKFTVPDNSQCVLPDNPTTKSFYLSFHDNDWIDAVGDHVICFDEDGPSAGEDPFCFDFVNTNYHDGNRTRYFCVDMGKYNRITVSDGEYSHHILWGVYSSANDTEILYDHYYDYSAPNELAHHGKKPDDRTYCLGLGCVMGCGDSDAVNYDPSVTDADPSACEYNTCPDPLACNYVPSGSHPNTDVCAYPDPSETLVSLEMNDLIAYGWNFFVAMATGGGSWSHFALDGTGTTHHFCLDLALEHEIAVTNYFVHPEVEQSWTLSTREAMPTVLLQDSYTVGEDARDFDYCYGTSCGVYGCLDPMACTPDSDATLRNPRMCTYPTEEMIAATLTLFEAYGDSWSGHYMTITEDGANYREYRFDENVLMNKTFGLCVDLDKYVNISVFDGTFSQDVSWTFARRSDGAVLLEDMYRRDSDDNGNATHGENPEHFDYCLGNGCVMGCVDQAACSYEPRTTAPNRKFCTYPTLESREFLAALTISSTWTSGWNGHELRRSVDGTDVAQYTLESGEVDRTYYFCMDNDARNELQMTQGAYSHQVAWSLQNRSNGLVLEEDNYYDGSDPTEVSYCIGAPCFGCTNAAACNFDDSVFFDDGSCDFQSCLPTTTTEGALLPTTTVMAPATTASSTDPNPTTEASSTPAPQATTDEIVPSTTTTMHPTTEEPLYTESLDITTTLPDVTPPLQGEGEDSAFIDDVMDVSPGSVTFFVACGAFSVVALIAVCCFCKRSRKRKALKGEIFMMESGRSVEMTGGPPMPSLSPANSFERDSGAPEGFGRGANMASNAVVAESNFDPSHMLSTSMIGTPLPLSHVALKVARDDSGSDNDGTAKEKVGDRHPVSISPQTARPLSLNLSLREMASSIAALDSDWHGLGNSTCVYPSTNEIAVTLEMFDTFGDGFNGHSVVFVTNDITVEYTFEESAYEKKFNFCVLTDSYTNVSITDGGWSHEVSWKLIDRTSGDELIGDSYDDGTGNDDENAGYHPPSIDYCIPNYGGCVNGCDNVTACNYDPAVTAHNWRECVAPQANSIPVTLEMFDTFGDGFNGHSVVVEANGTTDEYTFEEFAHSKSFYFCVLTDSYTNISITDGGWSHEVSWKLIDRAPSGSPTVRVVSPSEHSLFDVTTDLTANNAAIVNLCLSEIDGRDHVISVNSDFWSLSGSSWKLEMRDGSKTLLEDAYDENMGAYLSMSYATEDIQYCMGPTCNVGCTDTQACNSRPDFSAGDFRMCKQPQGSEVALTLTMNDANQDGWGSHAIYFENLDAESGLVEKASYAFEEHGSVKYFTFCLDLNMLHMIYLHDDGWTHEISWDLTERDGTILVGDDYADGNDGYHGGHDVTNLEYCVGGAEGECIMGCADESACNYDEHVTADNYRTCVYPDAEIGGVLAELNMLDSFGDGWGLHQWCVRDGETYASAAARADKTCFGFSEEGTAKKVNLCVNLERYNNVTVGPDDYWSHECSWSLNLRGQNNVIVEHTHFVAYGDEYEGDFGFADHVNTGTFSTCFGEGCVVACADTEAENYDPLYTAADNTLCEYPPATTTTVSPDNVGDATTTTAPGSGEETTIDVGGPVGDDGNSFGVEEDSKDSKSTALTIVGAVCGFAFVIIIVIVVQKYRQRTKRVIVMKAEERSVEMHGGPTHFSSSPNHMLTLDEYQYNKGAHTVEADNLESGRGGGSSTVTSTRTINRLHRQFHAENSEAEATVPSSATKEPDTLTALKTTTSFDENELSSV